MAPPTPIRAHWHSTPERWIAEHVLELQMLRSEMYGRLRNIRLLNSEEQRRLDDCLALWELAAETEPALQVVLEARMARSEGRQPTPPPTPPAAPSLRRAA